MASRVWRDGTRRGIVYVEGRETAERVLEMTGRGGLEKSAPRRRLPKTTVPVPLEGAMAVYTDRRGRPFAWQIPFDISHWERVTALVDVD